jgi:hypothetical protein
MRGKTHGSEILSYLAPFGGITRIRFKGFVQDVSANSAPPLCWKVRRKRAEGKRKLRIKKEELRNQTRRLIPVSSS